MTSILGNFLSCFIPGFRREVYVIFALLGYYAASGGNSSPAFRDNLSVPNHLYQINSLRCVISQKNAYLNF
jgi:hypothetical protein